MVQVQPFRAWRPVRDKVHLVGSRSYVSYGQKDLAEKVRGNPYSFLHVIHPDLGRSVHLSRSERFRRVRRKFEAWCHEGIFVREEAPAFYLYEQLREGLSSIGIIGAVAVQDYLEGRVKVHEQTLTAREALFKEYLDATGINAEPVLLTAPDVPVLEEVIQRVSATRPHYDFSTTDRVQHRLWVIDDPDEQQRVTEAFATLDALYIADGHHRSASSALLASESGAGPEDPRAWCLAFIVPRSHLHIYNFDRVVTDLGGLDLHGFLKSLEGVGQLKRLEGRPDGDPRTGRVFVHVPDAWYELQLPPLEGDFAPEAGLDSARLSREVLGPVLGIGDLRTDERVSFVPGILGVEELEDLVARGRAKVAFHLRPVSFEQLTAVADAGGTMPPKSTYIEPKLRSGITIYSLLDR